MKKFKVLFLMLAMICLFSGCNGKSESGVDKKESESNTLLADINFDTNQKYGEDYFSGNRFNYFAKADDGKYYFIDANEYCLKAFDPQTQKAEVVCDKEGCEHLIGCDAYIDSLWYCLDNIYFYDEHLYIVNKTQDMYILVQMDKDGANRKDVVKFGVREPNTDGVVYTMSFNNGYLYYESPSGNGYKDTYDAGLMRVSLSTGEIECVIKKADYNNNYASNMKSYGGVEFFTMVNTNTGSVDENTGLYMYDDVNSKVVKLINGDISDYCINMEKKEIYYYVINDGFYKMDIDTKRAERIVEKKWDYPYKYKMSYGGNYIYTYIGNRQMQTKLADNEDTVITVYDTNGNVVNRIGKESNVSDMVICVGDKEYMFGVTRTGLVKYYRVFDKKLLLDSYKSGVEIEDWKLLNQ